MSRSTCSQLDVVSLGHSVADSQLWAHRRTETTISRIHQTDAGRDCHSDAPTGPRYDASLSVSSDHRPGSIPRWARLLSALSLLERKALFRDAISAEARGGTASDEILRSWEGDPSFRSAESFHKRLEADGLTQEELGTLASLSPEQMAHLIVKAPAWVLQVEECLARSPRQGALEWIPSQNSESDWMKMLGVADGFVQWSAAQLEAKMMDLFATRVPPCDLDAAVAMVRSQFGGRIASHLIRPLLLELNVARLRGTLVGETSVDRFADFVTTSRTRAYSERFMFDHPCLARALVESLNTIVETNLEFFARLANDWQEIRDQFFGGGDPGQLVHLSGGEGDSHRGGRSVRIAQFASGAKIVYKPRDLAIDQFYNCVLKWLNAKDVAPSIYVPRLLNRATHGWAEYIDHAVCTDGDMLSRFYVRQGAHLALLYLFDAIDFHFENLIAAGEQPVLIDLEALFHRRGIVPQSLGMSSVPEGMLTASVMRIGILPQRVRLQKDGPGWEISGLGGAPGQLSPFRALVLESIGTDEMKACRQHMPSHGSQNRPTYETGSEKILDHVDDLINGFSCVYTQAMTSCRELSGPNGLLREVGSLQTRAILRPTSYYARLLGEAHHPDYVRDGCARDLLFDRLWQDVEAVPELSCVIPAEQRALRAGDIPFFSMKAAERDLIAHDDEVIPGFSDRSSLSAVEEKLRSLGPKDLERQTWLIRASLATLATGQERPPGLMIEFDSESREETSLDQFREMARAIGDRILATGLETEDGLSWMGLRLAEDGIWALEPLGADLYTGVLGIGLFLGTAGTRLGDASFLRAARKIGQMVARQTVSALDTRSGRQAFGLGAFAGEGGYLYAFAHLSQLLDEPSLVDTAVRLIPHLEARIDDDAELDVIGGSAGCLLSALALHPLLATDEALNLADRCANRILQTAKRLDGGIAWETSMKATAPLLGFSHGAAGIGAALLRLWQVTGRNALLAAAASAFKYEHHSFDSSSCNWPDFRVLPGRSGAGLSTTWCHGAPGVGLSRLSAIRAIGDSAWKRDVEIAVETTIRDGFEGSDCLCHGILGNVDFVLDAGRAFERLDWSVAATNQASRLLQRIRKAGWFCGVPLGTEIPGLMTGLAGVGYGFLRLGFPGDIPSILTLEGPRSALPVSSQGSSVHGPLAEQLSLRGNRAARAATIQR